MEMPLNLVHILINENQNLQKDDKVLVDYLLLEKIYSNFSSKILKIENHKILNLAFDEENNLLGYVLEASLEENIQETKLYFVK